MAHLMEPVQGTRSWIRMDTSGKPVFIKVDKVRTMMKLKFDLPAHDFHLLDPLFARPTPILGREKAILVGLEHIRGIITADEVLFFNFRGPRDPLVCPLVPELQRRFDSADLRTRRGWTNFHDKFGITCPENSPFEFMALEVMLQAACTHLDLQATKLEDAVYPLLNELTSKISTSNLEGVRRLKIKLVTVTRNVQKIRDEIEQLVSDKGKLAEMRLTQKKQKMESTSHGDHSLLGLSVSEPVSPVASPRDGRKLEKSFSIAKSRHEGIRSSESATNKIELEMLLETFLVKIDSILKKLTSLKKYIKDTENIINIQLDSVRNKLIKFELLLTIMSFVVSIFGMVAGIFGMNFPVSLYHSAGAFKWVLTITGAIGITILLPFYCWFFKYKRLTETEAQGLGLP